MSIFDLPGQGWLQLQELGLAFILSALIGLEREVRHKSAGLRTYTLVGVSAALFMLISKYGFNNVLAGGRVVLDPSRVAAQIVSGIGFIGGGVIFMRRDVVRGLTTAASVWLAAALGMACGAGLPVLALATTALHLIIMFVFPKLMQYLPRESRSVTRLRIAYADGRGLLRTILVTSTGLRFAIDQFEVERDGEVFEQDAMPADAGPEAGPRKGIVVLRMRVKGKRPIAHLIAALSDIDGVARVATEADEDALE